MNKVSKITLYLLTIAVCITVLPGNIFPDETDGMKKLYDKNGFGVYFIFYREGNGINNNGVVIYIRNKNDYKITYKFTLIFRSGETGKIREVSGILDALERRTGSDAGLFFIPFDDGHSISEVGIKSCSAEKLQ